MGESLLVASARGHIQALALAFHPWLPVTLACSLEEATDLVVSSAWLGAIIDFGDGDVTGRALLDTFLAVEPRAPVLVLAERCDPWLVNEVHGRLAFLSVAPTGVADLRAFCDVVAAHRDDRAKAVDLVMDAFTDHFSLTPTERAVLTSAVNGTPIKARPRRQALAVDTVSTAARGLLRKCADAETLEGVAAKGPSDLPATRANGRACR